MSPTSDATGPAEIPMLIGGLWRTASETYEVHDTCRNTISILRALVFGRVAGRDAVETLDG